jgi:hypothetical protein
VAGVPLLNQSIHVSRLANSLNIFPSIPRSSKWFIAYLQWLISFRFEHMRNWIEIWRGRLVVFHSTKKKPQKWVSFTRFKASAVYWRHSHFIGVTLHVFRKPVAKQNLRTFHYVAQVSFQFQNWHDSLFSIWYLYKLTYIGVAFLRSCMRTSLLWGRAETRTSCHVSMFLVLSKRVPRRRKDRLVLRTPTSLATTWSVESEYN